MGETRHCWECDRALWYDEPCPLCGPFPPEQPAERPTKWGRCEGCGKALTKRENLALTARLALDQFCRKCYLGTPSSSPSGAPTT